MKSITLEKKGVGRIRLRGCDEQEVTDEVIEGICNYMEISEGKGIIIGLSGGVDSSLTAALCKKAMDRREGTMHAIIMPSENNNEVDLADAKELAQSIGLQDQPDSKFTYRIVPIDNLIHSFASEFPLSAQGIPYENTQARIRMIILYALKESTTGLRVAGTGNRDEDYGLGYFTKYGDGGVDFLPIAELPKRLVRALARHNGVADKIVDKVPTAGLRKGQTDHDDVGCSYFQAEVIVAGADQMNRNDILEVAHGAETEELEEKYKEQLQNIDQDMIDRVLYRHEHLAPHKLNMPPRMKISFNY